MTETESMSSYIEINGCRVWYEKFGYGPKPLLLIPGAIGTGRTDFWPQLDEDEDALDFDQFTIIAVEAPGWGRSRPPARKYGTNHYNNDAQCFNGVMQHLGFEKYSIIGWSDGARVALLMAITYSNSIQSLVLISISTTVTDSALKFMLSTKNIESWGKDKIDSYLRSYKTKDEIQDLWTKFIYYVQYYKQYFPEDIFKNKYHMVKCPVLILHGDKNQMIDIKQPQHVCENIKNAKLERLSSGAHDLHLRYPTIFKKLVENHLLNGLSSGKVCPEEKDYPYGMDLINQHK